MSSDSARQTVAVPVWVPPSQDTRVRPGALGWWGHRGKGLRMRTTKTKPGTRVEQQPGRGVDLGRDQPQQEPSRAWGQAVSLGAQEGLRPIFALDLL